MKRLSCITVLVCGLTALDATARTFTSTDGKTIDAEVLGADGLQATLKLADGRQTVVPLNRLCQADQDFVLNWLKQNPQAIRYSFVVDAAKEKVDSKESRRGVGVSMTTTKWLYHLKITNRASQPVEGLKVSYQIHYTDMDGKAKSTEFKSGTKELPALKAGESTSVDTDAVELVTTKLDSGYAWGNGAPARQTDTLKGIAVTIEHNGKSVHEFTSGTSVKKIAQSPQASASKKPRPSSPGP